MIELPPGERLPLAPLFAGFPFMPTVVNAVIHEGMGRALADGTKGASVGVAKLDFTFVAGDPTCAAARAFLENATDSLVFGDERWIRLVQAVYGDMLRTHTRTAFGGVRFDRALLARTTEQLPPGFAIVKVDRSNVEDFSTLGPALVGNFNSVEDYLQIGIGFGILHEGQFVSAVSSFCVAGKDLEIEIQTRPAFRRRGFAMTATAKMILHCLDHGITPHWDAHNEMSAQLARKLGFCNERKYETYTRAAD